MFGTCWSFILALVHDSFCDYCVDSQKGYIVSAFWSMCLCSLLHTEILRIPQVTGLHAIVYIHILIKHVSGVLQVHQFGQLWCREKKPALLCITNLKESTSPNVIQSMFREILPGQQNRGNVCTECMCRNTSPSLLYTRCQRDHWQSILFKIELYIHKAFLTVSHEANCILPETIMLL